MDVLVAEGATVGGLWPLADDELEQAAVPRATAASSAVTPAAVRYGGLLRAGGVSPEMLIAEGSQE